MKYLFLQMMLTADIYITLLFTLSLNCFYGMSAMETMFSIEKKPFVCVTTQK